MLSTCAPSGAMTPQSWVCEQQARQHGGLSRHRDGAMLCVFIRSGALRVLGRAGTLVCGHASWLRAVMTTGVALAEAAGVQGERGRPQQGAATGHEGGRLCHLPGVLRHGTHTRVRVYACADVFVYAAMHACMCARRANLALVSGLSCIVCNCCCRTGARGGQQSRPPVANCSFAGLHAPFDLMLPSTPMPPRPHRPVYSSTSPLSHTRRVPIPPLSLGGRASQLANGHVSASWAPSTQPHTAPVVGKLLGYRVGLKPGDGAVNLCVCVRACVCRYRS
jgi:hypothetical protein